MNCIVYCRKSSEDVNRQILSIDSQESEMRKLAKRNGLKIVKMYKESMTAKAPGRPVFAEMITFVEKNESSIILVWKLDRLARNPIDEGRIKWLLQQGIIQEIKTPERDYQPQDNVLITSVEFGMANQFIRDLRQNVLRGNRAKLERGGWPNMAPFGYSNNKADRSVVINPLTAPAVQISFKLYASGNYSLKELTEVIYKQGFRTKAEKKISKSNIHKILNNPFYYGIMVKDDVSYQGKHEPLISKELFDRASYVLSGKHHRKRQKHVFPLSGIMSCAVCGCMLTASFQKKKHLYYYCTNGKGICNQRRKHLKAKDAYALISSELQKLKINERLLKIAALASEEKHQNDKVSKESTRQILVKRMKSVERLQDVLARRKNTPDDVYARNMTALQKDKVELENQLSNLDTKSDNTKITFEQVKKVFLEANSIANSFLDADDNLKRRYSEILLSNVSIKDNKVACFQYKMPYQRIAEIPKNPTIDQLYTGVDEVRTALLLS